MPVSGNFFNRSEIKKEILNGTEWDLSPNNAEQYDFHQGLLPSGGYQNVLRDMFSSNFLHTQ